MKPNTTVAGDDGLQPQPAYAVRTRTQARRYRAGYCFGYEPVQVGLSPQQLALVQADHELVCEGAPVPELTLEAGSDAVPASSKVKAKAKASA